MAGEVEVAVGLDAALFQKEMEKLSKSVEKMGTQINDTLATKVNKPLDIFKGTLAALAVDKGMQILAEQFRKLGAEISESMDLASSKQALLQRLEFTLTNTKRGAGEATKGFAEFADQMSRSTRFTDLQVLSSANLLAATSNLSDKGIKKAITAAADLATVMDVDLETATRSLAKAEEGHLDRNLKMILGIEEAGSAQATYARVLTKLEELQGQASSTLDTYAGKVDQVGKSYKDVQKAIGDIIINNKAVLGFLDALKEELDSSAASTKSNASNISQNISDSLLAAIAFSEAVVRSLDFVARAFKVLYDVVVISIGGIPAILEKALSVVIKAVTSFVGYFDKELGEKMKASLTGFTSVLDTQAGYVADRFGDIKEQFVGDSYLGTFADNISNMGVRVAQSVEDAYSKVYKLSEAEIDQFMKEDEERDRKARKKRQDQLAAEGKLQADITSLVAQAGAERAHLENQLNIINDSGTSTDDKKAKQLEEDYNFEVQKNSIVFDAEMDKTKFIKDEDERRLAQQKLAADLVSKNEAAAAKRDFAVAQDFSEKKKKIKELELTATENFISAGLTLAREGTAGYKALSYAQAIVSTYAGATRAYEEYPFPANVAVAASIVAMGLANVAKISGVQFATGGYLNGVVPGGSVTGDKVNVSVNSREMILTTQQQAELFRLANGGGSNNNSNINIEAIVAAIRSTPIVVQANGREIARLVREEGRSGFSF